MIKNKLIISTGVGYGHVTRDQAIAEKLSGKIINLNAEEIFRNIHKDFDEKIIFTISDREKPLIGGIKDIRIIRM